MSPYAQGTKVSTDQSRTQIERALMRAGARAFAYGITDSPASARIMCEFGAVRIRIDLPLPSAVERQFTHTATGRLREERSAREEYARETRRRYRALLLVVKAKLEAVESGITTFEEEFLAHLVLPDGQTFWEWARPQLAIAYAHHEMPALLPGGAS